MTGFFEGTGGEVGFVPHDLDSHTDVVIAAPTDGQILIYDAGLAVWKNQDDTVGNVTLAINDLSDVAVTAPTDGQVITYNTASGQWVNATSSGTGAVLSLTELTDVTLTNPTLNNVLRYDGGQWINGTTSISTENPVTIGSGANGTNATLILNAGTNPGATAGDYARVEFQNGGVTSYRMGTSMTAGVATLYTVDWTVPATPRLATLLWTNPNTPETPHEYALMNKTQFRIYTGDALTDSDRVLESFGAANTDRGLRIIDTINGQTAVHMASTTTDNQVLITRKGTTSAVGVKLSSGSTDNSAIVEVDGKVSLTGSGLGSYELNSTNLSAINLATLYPTVNNSGVSLRSRSTGGTNYDLTLAVDGNLQWRGVTIANSTGSVVPGGLTPIAIGTITSDGSGAQSVANCSGVSVCSIVGNGFQITLTQAVANVNDMVIVATAASTIGFIVMGYTKNSTTQFTLNCYLDGNTVTTQSGTEFSFQVFKRG